MSRKLKKGYFVQGQFVAEGSELDLQMKAELKGTDAASRTELKRESTALQALGEELMDLRADLLAGLALPDILVDALKQAAQITNFEGKRRQMQFIGKLMRKLDAETVEQIRIALQIQRSGAIKDAAALHQAEEWRDALIADEDKVGQWLAQNPGTDAQQLRSLVRQARKDAKPEKPGQTPRHGRAYREIFQLVRTQLTGGGPIPDNDDHES
jgi:ribosome-associated protein